MDCAENGPPAVKSPFNQLLKLVGRLAVTIPFEPFITVTTESGPRIICKLKQTSLLCQQVLAYMTVKNRA